MEMSVAASGVWQGRWIISYTDSFQVVPNDRPLGMTLALCGLQALVIYLVMSYSRK
jgi:hypothetical protein